MDFASAVKSGLVNWNKFSGIASKREYWFFYLFTWIVSQLVGLIDRIAQPQLNANSTAPLDENFLANNLPIPSLIASLILLVPTLAATYRRIQDGGRPGKLAFLQLIPIGLAAAVVAFIGLFWRELLSGDYIVLDLAFLGLGFLLIVTAVSWLVFWLSWTLAPTITKDQGNRFAD